MAYKQIVKKKKIICSGDLNKKIKVQIRSITAPNVNDIDYEQTYTDFITKWAMIETKKGVEVFDEVNTLKGVATHYFYIRYSASITFENMVEYKLKKFRILDVQNLDEDDKFYLIRCDERGVATKDANLQ